MGTCEEIIGKMDALNLWDEMMPFNWAVKPFGIVMPYFCTIFKSDPKYVKAHFFMLEGWQTLHDYMRVRADRDFGYKTSFLEFAHYQVILLTTGEIKILRHDPLYMPQDVTARERDLIARILWESYGLMLRVENDKKLLLKYISERGIFARVEVKKNEWKDESLTIPAPPPYVEQISFPKEAVKAAKDAPFNAKDVLHVHFHLAENVMTCDKPRPRAIYQLIAYDPAKKANRFILSASAMPELGLKGLWEAMPFQLMHAMTTQGGIPGEIKVKSGRMFRFLRPLCMELPIKLSLHDKLEGI